MEVFHGFSKRPTAALALECAFSELFRLLWWTTFAFLALTLRQAHADSPALFVTGVTTYSKAIGESQTHIRRLNRNALFRGKFQITTPDGLELVARRRARSSESNTKVRQGKVLTQSVSGNLYEKNDSYFDHKVGEFYLTAGLGDRDSYPALHLTFSNSDLDRTYTIKSDGTRRHFTLLQVDETKRRNCSGAVARDSIQSPVAAADAATTPVAGDNVVVDVLILYSAEAYAGVGGETNMATEANNAIASANQGYINSGIALQLRLVHVTHSATSEVGALTTDLNRLTTIGDGFYDEAPTLAATYYADVVTVFTEAGDYCGIGYIGYGYNVVARGCISNYSFQHEVGHNFGSDHDIANGGSGLYPYSNGWRFTGNSAVQYRTVMSYAPGTRINYFSNPDVNFDGVATGTSTANNAMSHQTFAPELAATRTDPGNSTTPAPTPTATPSPTPGSSENPASISVARVRQGKTYLTSILYGDQGSALESVSLSLYFKGTVAKKYKKKLTFPSSSGGVTVQVSKKGRYYIALTDNTAIHSAVVRVK